jgi:hypothetical protein
MSKKRLVVLACTLAILLVPTVVLAADGAPPSAGAGFVDYILYGGGAGVIAFWFLSTPLGKRVAGQFARLARHLGCGPKESKRILALIVSGVVALVIYGGAGLIGITALPETGAGWWDIIKTLPGFAFLVSQILHGRHCTFLPQNRAP